MAERGLGKCKGENLATRILSILVRGEAMLEMDMESMEEGTTDVGGSWKSDGGKLIYNNLK